MTTTVREQLIEAAEGQFRRFGYRRTTIDDVTRVAEVGKGSFYLHFPSKEAAYMAVVEASLERFLAEADAALHQPGSVPRRLRTLVAVTAEHYGKDELLRASLFGEAALVDGTVAREAADIQRSRIRALLAEVLTQGIEDGSIRADLDVEATAAVLFEIGWAIVRSELDDTAELPLVVALDTLNDIVGMGLVARSPAAKP
ncbi:MAG: TetR/AcrR family transcriptional regulator [Acidimicrobiia bacterium]